MKGAIDMISRHWRGLAKSTHADEYVEPRHSPPFGYPGVPQCLHSEAQGAGGRRIPDRDQLESIKKIEQFSGREPETSVVPEKVRKMMMSTTTTCVTTRW